jgi:hypothetical protein
MATWERGWLAARWERMQAMRGGTPAGLRELMGVFTSNRRRTVLVLSRAETAKQRSATSALLDGGGDPVSHRLTDWMAARDASFGDDPGEERALARQNADAACIRRQRAASSEGASCGEGGGHVHVLQCRKIEGVAFGRDGLDSTNSRQSVLRFWRLRLYAASTRDFALSLRIGSTVTVVPVLFPLPS